MFRISRGSLITPAPARRAKGFIREVCVWVAGRCNGWPQTGERPAAGGRQPRDHKFPGRAGGFPPAPPQSRTSPIKAYGSSGGTASLRSRRYPWGLVHRHSDLRVSGLLLPHGSVCPRPLPSLLPGFLGLVRRLSIGTTKRLRLPLRFFRRSVRHIASEYPGLACLLRSLRRASPLPQGPDVVKPVHPSRRLVPRTRTGLPCSQGTPMCLCPALRPRPDLGA